MILAFLHFDLPTGSFTLNFYSLTRGTDAVSVAKSQPIRSRWLGSVVCRRTDRLGSCTSTKTSSYACFYPVIELSGIIIHSLWTNVLEFASGKHADITRNQICWEESCISRMSPKCLPVRSRTGCVHVWNLREATLINKASGHHDLMLKLSRLFWDEPIPKEVQVSVIFSLVLSMKCVKWIQQLRLWHDWLNHGVCSSAILTWRANHKL